MCGYALRLLLAVAVGLATAPWWPGDPALAAEQGPAEQSPADQSSAPPAVQAPASGSAAPAPPGTPSPPPFKLSGETTWTLKYALGDREGLPAGGEYLLGRPVLKQLLQVTLDGEVAPGVAVNARLDNYRSENLQLIDVTLSGWWGRARFGDLRPVSPNPYVLQTLTLKGVELQTDLGPWRVSGTVARVRGTPASRTFYGNTSADTTLFRMGGPYAPTRSGAQLVADLEGAEHFELAGRFDRDFMALWVQFTDLTGAGGAPPARSLEDVLAAYGLGFLLAGDEPGHQGVLTRGDYVEVNRGRYLTVPGASADFLLLRRESLELARDQIEQLIRRYNEVNGLAGDERRQYPLVSGSQVEEEFLTELRDEHLRLWAGPFRREAGEGAGEARSVPVLEEPPLLDRPLALFERRRFYPLGHEEIAPDSVTVEAGTGTAFSPAAEAGLSYALIAGQGVLELAFDDPEGFFDTYDRIRVSYRYTVSGNIYTLGISVAAGSDRVYLNGALLQRDVDYTVDYEAGILMLLRSVGPGDVVRIDYEHFRGGLGGFAEYNRNLFSLALEWSPGQGAAPSPSQGSGAAARAGGNPWRFSLDLLRAADESTPRVEPERAKTMPNSHTVLGISTGYALGGFRIDADLAYSHDRFPFDANGRINQANRVHAIFLGTESSEAGEGPAHVLVGHQDGLLVADPSEPGWPGTGWHAYGVGAGLAGWTVRGIAQSAGAWYLATDAGLTGIIRRRPDPGTVAPFDNVGNWFRRYTTDGLPSNDLWAAAVAPASVAGLGGTYGTLWVGTSDGAAFVELPAPDLEEQMPPFGGTEDDPLSGWRVLRRSEYPGLAGDRITHLAVEESAAGGSPGDAGPAAVWLGGPEGLSRWSDGRVELAWRDGGDGQQAVRALLAVGQPAGPVPAEEPWPQAGVYAALAGGELKWRPADPLASGAASENWETVLEAGVLGGREILSLAAFDGALWIGTSGGLYRMGSDRTPAPVDLPPFADPAISALGVLAAPEGVPDAVPPQLWAGDVAQAPPGGAEPEIRLWSISEGQSQGAPVVLPAGLVPGVDQRRYQDPPTESLATGFAGRIQASQQWGNASIEARYERIEPGFLPIGGTERRHLESWSLGSRYPLGEALTLQGEYGVRVAGAAALPSAGDSPATVRTVTIEGRSASLVWSPAAGPQARLSFRSERIDDVSDPAGGLSARGEGLSGPIGGLSDPQAAGQTPGQGGGAPDPFDKLRQTAEASVDYSLWEGRARLSTGYTRVQFTDQVLVKRSYVSEDFSADARLRPLEGLQLSARYRRPVKLAAGAEQPEGSQTLQWSGQWAAPAAEVLRPSLGYSREIRLGDPTLPWAAGADLGEEALQRDHQELTAQLTTPRLPVAGGTWVPSLKLSWSDTFQQRLGRQQTQGGEGSLRLEWASLLRAELKASQSRTGVERDQKTSLQRRLSGSFSWIAWSHLTPSADAQLTATDVSSQTYGSRQVLAGTASARLNWRLLQGVQEAVAVTYRGQRGDGKQSHESHEASVSSTLSVDTGQPWSGTLTLSGRQSRQGAESAPWAQLEPQWRAEASVSGGYRFSDRWKAGLSVSFALGSRTAAQVAEGKPPIYRTAATELAVTAAF